jgi:hypothetical protein
MKLAGSVFATFLLSLFASSNANGLRKSTTVDEPADGEDGLTKIRTQMNKIREQQADVARLAAVSAKKSAEEVLMQEQVLNAKMAVESSEDASSASDIDARIEKAERDIRFYKEQAKEHLKHTEMLREDIAKLPKAASEFSVKFVAEEVRKDAYAAAERSSNVTVESDEDRALRAAENVAAAAEPYHFALLRAQKNAKENYAKSKRASETARALASDAQDLAAQAEEAQAQGRELMARQDMVLAKTKAQKSADMKYWVKKFYSDAKQWNSLIGPYNSEMQQAAQSASQKFEEKAYPDLPTP